jgi:hypothetical protein
MYNINSESSKAQRNKSNYLEGIGHKMYFLYLQLLFGTAAINI